MEYFSISTNQMLLNVLIERKIGTPETVYRLLWIGN